MASKGTKQESKPELRIVLVGKTGVGKSAVGNIILREKVFEARLSSTSVTTKCQKETGEFEGQILAVIDTPGLFDTYRNEEEIKEEIIRSMSFSAPGPHVILVVLQPNRFTPEEKETVKILQKMFGEKSADYMMILFTQGDVLERENMTIERVIGQNSDLCDFIKQCHGGYHIFNTIDEDPSQVRELLNKINLMIERNGGSCYTNEMFREAERAIIEEMERLLRENPQIQQQEARRQAERENNFLRCVLAAAGIGAAIGAAVGGAAGGPIGAVFGAKIGVAVGASGGAAVETEVAAAVKTAVRAVSAAVEQRLCVTQ